jgi:hypothetical protein
MAKSVLVVWLLAETPDFIGKKKREGVQLCDFFFGKHTPRQENL